MSSNGGHSALPRPFLKWAGGKRQLLGELRARLGDGRVAGRYFEPFLGGGAFFFDLYRRALLGGRKKAVLSDTNENLLEAYLAVQEDVEGVIEALRVHAAAHVHDYFYAVRSEVPEERVGRAARIIYLNKTCYNGLYRENKRGDFNVPMGRYKNPLICDAENLRTVATSLGRAKVVQRGFSAVLDEAEAGDFVYFDPPYDPVSKTASFTSYAKGGFGEAEQRALAAVFGELSQRGVMALLSNSMTPLVKKLYSDKAFRLETVYATRNVNSRADRRGKVAEVLVESEALAALR
jgi:DNA adenine methylase